MFTTNLGSFAWDVGTGNAGLIWPRGTSQTAVFASGLWLGCWVGGAVRGAVAEYSFEYGPGSMVGPIPDDPTRAAHRVYKVVRWRGNPADTAHVDRTAGELAADPLLDPLAHHSWSEYVNCAAPPLPRGSCPRRLPRRLRPPPAGGTVFHECRLHPDSLSTHG